MRNTHNEIMRREGYVSAREAADAVGRSLSTIHRWADAGTVHSTRSGTRLFIDISSLEELFKENEVMLERLEVLHAGSA